MSKTPVLSIPIGKSDPLFVGTSKLGISQGVVIPDGQSIFWSSGTVPPVFDETADEGSVARYGDTRTQAIGILRIFERQLAELGSTLKDAVYLRVYVVGDPTKDGKPDFQGWFAAYAEFFGTEANPTKVARSTVAVSALVNPGWLIEIEMFAVVKAK